MQRPYLGHRQIDPRSNAAGEYQWITYREAGEARTAIGSGLVHLGVTPGSTIGIYSINSVGTFFNFLILICFFKI
jgi:long-subunit acyl-CoA synthetase (AMP-forming)